MIETINRGTTHHAEDRPSHSECDPRTVRVTLLDGHGFYDKSRPNAQLTKWDFPQIEKQFNADPGREPVKVFARTHADKQVVAIGRIVAIYGLGTLTAELTITGISADVLRESKVLVKLDFGKAGIIAAIVFDLPPKWRSSSNMPTHDAERGDASLNLSERLS